MCNLSCACEHCRVHASVHNHFPTERHLQDRHIYKQTRAAALAEWRGLLVA